MLRLWMIKLGPENKINCSENDFDDEKLRNEKNTIYPPNSKSTGQIFFHNLQNNDEINFQQKIEWNKILFA